MVLSARLILCDEVAAAPVSLDQSLLEIIDRAFAALSMDILGELPGRAR